MTNINKFEILKTFIAILLSIAITFCIIFLVSEEPFTAIYYFVIGPITSIYRFSNVLESFIPLVFSGLAISIMFKAKQFNIGVAGYFYIGGVLAVPVAVYTNIVFLSPILAIFVGGLAGAFFASIPAILKAKWGTSELVISLMFNYILYLIGALFIKTFFRDPTQGSIVSVVFNDYTIIPKIVDGFGIHYGLFLVIFVSFFTWLFLYRSRYGYALRIVGSNKNFAKYAGINVFGSIIFSQLLGGFIAGAGGAVEMVAMYNRYRWDALPSYGWDGILVAIIAKNNPAYVPIAALFMAYLRIGADVMARQSDVQSELISVVSSIMIVLVASYGFLPKLRQRFILKDVEENRNVM